MTNEMEITAARILGEWAMMLVEPESPERGTQIFESEEPLYCAALKFTGMISGRYVILCQRNFAINLTQNLLCGEEPSNDQELLDALEEMANVFGGNLLTATYGVHEVFSLTSPVSKIISKEETEEFKDKKIIWLNGDGEPVGVVFMPEALHP